MLSNTTNTVICMTENQVEDIRMIFKDKHQKKNNTITWYIFT